MAMCKMTCRKGQVVSKEISPTSSHTTTPESDQPLILQPYRVTRVLQNINSNIAAGPAPLKAVSSVQSSTPFSPVTASLPTAPTLWSSLRTTRPKWDWWLTMRWHTGRRSVCMVQGEWPETQHKDNQGNYHGLKEKQTHHTELCISGEEVEMNSFKCLSIWGPDLEA